MGKTRRQEVTIEEIEQIMQDKFQTKILRRIKKQ
jgi:ribosomal protein L20A (L18A)